MAFTDEELIARLQKLYREKGGPISGKDLKAAGGSPSTYAKRFGSWDEALTAAGIHDRVPYTQTPSRTKEELIQEIQRCAKELEGTPSRNIFHQHTGFPKGPVETYFKNWTSALTAAGLQSFKLIPGKKTEQEKAARRRAAERRRERKLEELTRFGLPTVREGSQTQFLLTRMVARALNSPFEVEHSPEWLINPETGKAMRLDAYFPELKVAFEYQSELHFGAGFGESRHLLENTIRRDYIKRQLLSDNDVLLLEIAYFEPHTEDYIRQKIQRQLCK